MPFDVLTVMVAVATLLLDVDHVTVLITFLLGETVALRVSVLPLLSVAEVLLSLTLVGRFLTVTLQVAFLPFAVCTVIVAVPAAFPPRISPVS